MKIGGSFSSSQKIRFVAAHKESPNQKHLVVENGTLIKVDLSSKS